MPKVPAIACYKKEVFLHTSLEFGLYKYDSTGCMGLTVVRSLSSIGLRTDLEERPDSYWVLWGYQSMELYRTDYYIKILLDPAERDSFS